MSIKLVDESDSTDMFFQKLRESVINPDITDCNHSHGTLLIPQSGGRPFVAVCPRCGQGVPYPESVPEFI